MKHLNEHIKDDPEHEEMQAKIRLKKIETKFERRIANSTIQQNKKTIEKNRKENTKMHVMFVDATQNRDARIVRSVLSNFTRHKSVGLSLRNKSLEGAKEELYEHLHKLQSKMNKLKTTRKDRVEQLKSLQQKLQEVKSGSAATAESGGDGAASRVRQLENSLDKMQIKQASAKRMTSIYDVMKKRLDEQVVNYPATIKELEKTKAIADKESEQLMSAHSIASIENEEIQKRKDTMKAKVEKDMRQRLMKLRKLRNKLAKSRSDSDDQHENELLSKRKPPKEPADIEPLLRKRRQSVITIDSYAEQAMLVQDMIGVPFADIDRLAACFVSQTEKTKHLENDIARLKSTLFEKTELYRDLRKQFENPAGYFKLKFEEELFQKEKTIAIKTEALLKSKVAFEKREYFLACFRTILQNVFSKMIECARKYGRQLPNEVIVAYDGELGLPELLSLVGKVLDVINESALNKTPDNLLYKTPESLVEDKDEENRFHRRMEKLVHKNNNRLRFQLQEDEDERQLIDPEYEGAADNKNYLSREKVKLMMQKITRIHQ